MSEKQAKRKSAPWTAEDDEYIMNHYKTTTRLEIAKALQRTEGAVKNRMWKLDVLKDALKNVNKAKRDDRGWRDETSCTGVCICSAVIRGQTLEEIAEDVNRPLSQVEFVYERSLKDGTFDRVKRYLETPSEKSGGSSGKAGRYLRGRRAAVSD